MGIDFGFTEESRKKSKYARCRPYLKKVVGFYAEPPEAQSEDPWAGARRSDRVLNVRRLRDEQPELYEQLQQSRWHPESEDYWYWNRAWLGEAYDDRALRTKLRPYIETKPSGEVSLNRLAEDVADEALQGAAPEDQITGWDKLEYEGRKEVCEKCPVRPLDDWTCYLRFSSYPSMTTVRAGFLLTVAYGQTITDEQVKDALFSFPHLERERGELPKDKIRSLIDELEDVEVNKQHEEFANLVFKMVSAAAGPDDKVRGGPTDLSYIPFVDEFISKFIYRDEPYAPEEARELLPYLETLKETSDWALWDADEAPQRRPLIVFRDRMGGMIEGLKIADKYALEMYVSY